MRIPFPRRRARSSDAIVTGPVLAGYTMPTVLQRNRRKWLALLLCIAFFYGAILTVSQTFLVIPLSAPLMIGAFMLIWALPEREIYARPILEWMLFAYLVALMFWPDYLALSLPGMPWITAQRLTSLPLLFMLLILLSQSRNLRTEYKAILNNEPIIWKTMVAFSLLSVFSVAFSNAPGFSINRLVIAGLYWVQIFFVSCYVFTRPGAVRKFVYLLLAAVIFVNLIALLEIRMQQVPWGNHIPSFLAVDGDTLSLILAPSARAATGMYRAKSKFTTPLALAEFLGYAMPFMLHLIATERRVWLKIVAAATLPLSLYVIIHTDSRLGMVCFFSTILLYALYEGSRRWVSNRDSIFGPASVLAFPVTATVFFIATFFVGRLRNSVWGSGAQQASTDSRKEQYADGISKIISHPWGYGIGRSGDTLGFVSPSGIITIDTYYLVIGLELGIIGFIVYYGMFIYGGLRAASFAYRSTGEVTYLGPVAVMLMNFLIVKSIFSQTDNHPLAFAILGLAVALLYRRAQGEGVLKPALRQAAPVGSVKPAF